MVEGVVAVFVFRVAVVPEEVRHARLRWLRQGPSAVYQSSSASATHLKPMVPARSYDPPMMKYLL